MKPNKMNEDGTIAIVYFGDYKLESIKEWLTVETSIPEHEKNVLDYIEHHDQD